MFFGDTVKDLQAVKFCKHATVVDKNSSPQSGTSLHKFDFLRQFSQGRLSPLAACMLVTTRDQTAFQMPSFMDLKNPGVKYAAAICVYEDLLSKQFKKEIEKMKPSVYTAILAKQMQIRDRMMFDATRLAKDPSDITDVTNGWADEESLLKVED